MFQQDVTWNAQKSLRNRHVLVTQFQVGGGAWGRGPLGCPWFDGQEEGWVDMCGGQLI